jgi:hypothetical protein
MSEHNLTNMHTVGYNGTDQPNKTTRHNEEAVFPVRSPHIETVFPAMSCMHSHLAATTTHVEIEHGNRIIS